jgi:hypothetical protein
VKIEPKITGKMMAKDTWTPVNATSHVKTRINTSAVTWALTSQANGKEVYYVRNTHHVCCTGVFRQQLHVSGKGCLQNLSPGGSHSLKLKTIYIETIQTEIFTTCGGVLQGRRRFYSITSYKIALALRFVYTGEKRHPWNVYTSRRCCRHVKNAVAVQEKLLAFAKTDRGANHENRGETPRKRGFGKPERL